MPITCPYPEPDQLSPCPPPIPLSENPSKYYPPIYACVFQVVSFPQVSSPKPRIHLSSPHTCYMPRQSHSLLRSYQRISPVPRHMRNFRNEGFYCEELLAPRPTPGWRTAPCRLFVTAHSVYSQLPSQSEAVIPSAPCRGDRDLLIICYLPITCMLLALILSQNFGNDCVR